MENNKGTFSKGLTTLTIKKNNFIETQKCKTYISTLEKEINTLKFDIGNSIYEKWCNNESFMVDVEERLSVIKEKYCEIELQKERIISLKAEEEKILGGSSEFVYCSQCGTKYPAEYKYCSKCGISLR